MKTVSKFFFISFSLFISSQIQAQDQVTLNEIQLCLDKASGTVKNNSSGKKTVLKKQTIGQTRVEVYESRNGTQYGEIYPDVNWVNASSFITTSYINGFEEEHKELVKFEIFFKDDRLTCHWTSDGSVYQELKYGHMEFYVKKKDKDKVKGLLSSFIKK